MTTLGVSLGRLLMARSHLGAALRDGAFRGLTRIPGIRHAVLQLHYRPPARYNAVCWWDRGSPLVGGPIVPETDVRTFDGELRRLDDSTGTGWRIVGWEADPSRPSRRGAGTSPRTFCAQSWSRCAAPVGALSRPALLETVLEDMHEQARPSFGRRLFVVIRPEGLYAIPTRQELEATTLSWPPK